MMLPARGMRAQMLQEGAQADMQLTAEPEAERHATAAQKHVLQRLDCDYRSEAAGDPAGREGGQQWTRRLASVPGSC